MSNHSKIPTSRKARKETQRERLLEGMLLATLRRGYAGASVAQVIAHAGVSRPTFYEYFADKDDCFAALQQQISRAWIERVEEAVTAERPERAVQAGVEALLQLADAAPERARFLVSETLAGGRHALEHRDRLVADIERAVEQRRTHAPAREPSPDLPTRALMGGIFGLLAPRLRRGECDVLSLSPEIRAWVQCYNRPPTEHRWRTTAPGPALVDARHVSDLAPEPPSGPSRGRPTSASTAEIARRQRERIVYATADVAADKGYATMTIADIASAAGVDRRVFYAHFADKQQAFLAAHELAFQHTMAIAARAFFSCESWPERIWEGLRAKTHFNATHPTLSEIGYVEAHAVGPPAIQRVDDTRAAFNIFVHEGFLNTAGDREPPPAIALEAISATIYEICYQQARAGRVEQLPRLVAHAVYVVLAPFLGTERAIEFVDARVAEERAGKPQEESFAPGALLHAALAQERAR